VATRRPLESLIGAFRRFRVAAARLSGSQDCSPAPRIELCSGPGPLGDTRSGRERHVTSVVGRRLIPLARGSSINSLGSCVLVSLRAPSKVPAAAGSGHGRGEYPTRLRSIFRQMWFGAIIITREVDARNCPSSPGPPAGIAAPCRPRARNGNIDPTDAEFHVGHVSLHLEISILCNRVSVAATTSYLFPFRCQRGDLANWIRNA
jgi:hypothetical protein